MLEYIKRDKMELCDDLEREFKGCMYIVIDTNNDIDNLMGKLYCVSHSSDSFKEIRDIHVNLLRKGYSASLLGLYTNAWAPGLQYVVRDDCEVYI